MSYLRRAYSLLFEYMNEGWCNSKQVTKVIGQIKIKRFIIETEK